MRLAVPAVLALLLAAVSFLRPPRIETSMESLAGDAMAEMPRGLAERASKTVIVLSGLEGRDISKFVNPPGDIPPIPRNFVSPDDAADLCSPEGRARIAKRRVRRLFADPAPLLVPVAEDPFGLSENLMRSMASSGAVVLELNDETLSDIDKLVEFKEALGDAVAAGIPMHTATSALRAKREIAVLSAISAVFIVLLSLFVLRSFKWLWLVALSLATSALAGLLALVVFFGGFHAMTLVFGTTILGLVVDYSFHWLMRQAGSAGETVRKLVVSWATTELSLVPLLLSSLPVLRQSAVFLGTGLAASLAFVLLCYPKDAASASACLPPRRGVRRAKKRATFGFFAGAVLCLGAILFFARPRFVTLPEALYSPERSVVSAYKMFAGLSVPLRGSFAKHVAKLYEEQGECLSAALGIDLPAAPGGQEGPDAREWFLKLLARLTRETVACLCFSVFAMQFVLIFVFRKSPRCREDAFLAMTPSYVAIAAVLAHLGISGENVSLFHLMAMFLLLGMSLDYSVFLFGRGGARGHIKPVACSFATSMVGFGLLAFVSFPVIRAFGVTLGLGLPVAFVSAFVLSSSYRFSCPAVRSNASEHGASPAGMETLYLVYRVFGLRVLEILSSAVGAAVWLFSPAVRRASPRCGRTAAFARSLADKLVVMAEGRRLPRVETDGSGDAADFLSDVAEGRGAFILSSHIGTIEVLSALGETKGTFHAWMEFERTGVFNRFYMRHARRKKVVIHPVSEFGAASVFEAGAALDEGGALVMAADRPFGRIRREGAFVLAEGAFRFAKAMERNVYFIACVEKSFGRYTAVVRRLDRSSVDAMARDYAAVLESLAAEYPGQNFNWERTNGK